MNGIFFDFASVKSFALYFQVGTSKRESHKISDNLVERERKIFFYFMMVIHYLTNLHANGIWMDLASSISWDRCEMLSLR